MTDQTKSCRCHWCGDYVWPGNGWYPCCSEEHLDKLRADIDTDHEKDKIKLWAKFINHQYAAWAVLFELITGFKPPKLKEISAVISGH